MSDLDQAIRELVIANRVLAHEDVVDAYGHVSIRHPDNPKRYFLSRSRSPELVGPEDIMEFELDGTPVRGDTRVPYVERHIHGAIYARRPEVTAAVHSHAEATLPYGISTTPLRPVIHSGGFIGKRVPVWDINDKFGDTNLLVTTYAQGQDLAERLGDGRVCLMRGHGFAAAGKSLADVLRISIYIPKNARVLTTAMLLGGGVKALTPGEVEKRVAINPAGPETQRAWEYWAIRSGCEQFIEPARTTRRRAAAAAKAPARAKAAPKRAAAKKGPVKAASKAKAPARAKPAARGKAKAPARGRKR